MTEAGTAMTWLVCAQGTQRCATEASLAEGCQGWVLQGTVMALEILVSESQRM